MRRLLPGLVLLLVAALAVAELVLRDSGYVRLAWGDWVLETTLWLGLGLLLLALFVLRLLALLLLGIWRSPRRVSHWWRGLFARRHRRLIRRGLRAWLEGDWLRAAKWLHRGAPGSGDPVPHYLLAAHAQLRRGEAALAADLIQRAEQEGDDRDAVAIGLLRAEQWLAEGRTEAARDALRELQQRLGAHPGLLRQLVPLYRQFQDWAALEGLLPMLRKNRVLTEEALARLEFEVCAGLLAQAASAADGASGSPLTRCWQDLPGRLQRQTGLVAVYARALLAAGSAQEAEALLRRALKRGLDPELLELYGSAMGPHPDRQLALAESWLPQHPDNADLLLCLGRLALMNRLWGKAREYFQAALARAPEPRAYAELARLLAQLGEHAASQRCYARGLTLCTRPLPALPLPPAADRH